MKLTQSDLRDFLEEKLEFYNQPWFICNDPVSVPHQYSRNTDIETAAFFSATLAWGNRSVAVRKISRLLQMFDCEPYPFIMGASEREIQHLKKFVHRTFNFTDLQYFLKALRHLYEKHETLEKAFFPNQLQTYDVKNAISGFRNEFFSLDHPERTEKHLANPLKNASAKRLNLFLRWMIRKDTSGVDFGIWTQISPAQLMCPLDVHSGNVARKLGLLERKANDWAAVEELTAHLRELDSLDPVKYDIALFGLGIYEKFAS
jgi:uncharacterized protein (TIGR02757 family)